jgi:hypothetical protein
MQVKPGTRLKSQVCDTQIVIVRVPATDLDIRCGGSPMIPAADSAADGVELHADYSGGSLMGKRYADEGDTIEFLCSKAGAGSLSIGDAKLDVKGAKALPSSD